MNRLFIASPYFQFMIASNLVKHQFAPDDITDLLVVDDAPIFETVCEKAKQTGLFRHVGIARMLQHIKDIPKVSKSRERMDLIKMTLGDTENTYLGNVFYPLAYDYDEIWFYDYQTQFYGLSDILQKHHCIPRFVRYEESCFSTVSPDTEWRLGPKYDLMKRFRRMKGRRIIEDSIQEYYCFYYSTVSEKARGHYNIHRMALFDHGDRTLRDIWNAVFDIRPEEWVVDQKYIYFMGSFEVDGFSVKETEFVLKLAELVGKDNIIVKTHPRDPRDVLEKAGIKTFPKTSIPWEAIAMNIDLQSKTLLTLCSSAVSNLCSLFGMDIKSLFLGKMVKGQDDRFDKYFAADIEKVHLFQEEGQCRSCFFVESMEDLQRIIGEK